MKLEELHGEITARLKAEFGFKQHGNYLQQGTCPDCGKKELYTRAEKPFYIVCNRRSKCSYEITVKALMPELFENINEKYPSSDSDPHATATAYLQLMRGIDVEKIQGWYEQGAFHRQNTNKTTSTVRFLLDGGKIWWERFVENVELKHQDGSTETRDCHFCPGERAGLWWSPPKQTIEKGDRVYLCEGILKAIPLILSGKKAVSIMAAGSFPAKSIEPHLKKGVKWVWALDSDDAGRNATHKHHATLLEMGEKSSAVFSTEYAKKLDWDDLPEIFLDDDSFKRYAYFGSLELAESYQEKASLMWHYANDANENPEDDKNYFCFPHAKNLYSVVANRKAYEKQLDELINVNPLTVDENKLSAFIGTAEIKRIATFAPQFLYFQRFDNGEDGEYVFKFRMSNGSHDQIVGFSHLAKADSFKEKCQKLVAGANFMGSNADISWLYNRWMNHKPATVSNLSYIGYCIEHDAYIFNKMAVQGKKIIPINDQDFFQLKKGGLKTSITNHVFDISKTVKFDWFSDYKKAFSAKGLVVLTWWTASLLIQQIKARHKDFPYLSVIGTAASGKTAMVNFLWKLVGLDGARMPINPNLATKASFYRHLATFSNIPVQFNEVDNEQSLEHVKGKHIGRFNWNELKPLYDGEALRQTANKNHSNNINTPVFKSNLLVTQNIEISDASEAIVTRFVGLFFDRSHHTIPGKEAADRLLLRDVADCSGFLLHVISKAKEILAEYEKQLPYALKRLNCFPDEITHQRVKDTHAKVLAMAYCLELIIPAITKEDIADIEFEIIEAARKRQEMVNGDHALIVKFWEMFDDLDSSVNANGNVVTGEINHSSNDYLIAVHLPTFNKRCIDKFGVHLELDDLRRLLPTSKERPFKIYDGVHSAKENKTMKCYVFYKTRELSRKAGV
jgi:hypothetical protein